MPFVMLSYMQIVRFHMIAVCITFASESQRSSFDNLRFSLYTLHIILPYNCTNTVALAEQSLHHNIILEKLDHVRVIHNHH
jgi:hypothetical protein